MSIPLTLLMCAQLATAREKSLPFLIREWKGAYGGVPPFDKVKIADFPSALEQGMELSRQEIKAIAENTTPPTFANTVEALEKSGEPLDRAMTLFRLWTGNLKNDEVKAIEKTMAPKLASFRDEMYLNEKLFQRIDAVYQSPAIKELTPEQRRLAWNYDNDFIAHGAKLEPKQKTRVSEINQKLASLYTTFSQNVLADEENQKLVIENENELDGLTPAAKANAREKQKMKTKWVFPNTRSVIEPLLTEATNRAVREKAFKMWMARGDGGEHDNNPVITEIMKLRLERSKLMGFKNYAEWHLHDSMAKEPARAMEQMLRVWKPAVAQVQIDVKAMQALVDQEAQAAKTQSFKIEPWDYRHYADKVRQAKFDLDFDLVKPYLQLENVQKAMFWVAGQLYGFEFKPVKKGVPVFHPDVTVFEVVRDKKHVGLWYFDPYARAGKGSGAWMTSYRPQQKFGKVQSPLLSNNSNFVHGQPVLLSWDDATTMFHEFGHALHGLNSNVTYASLSGTNTFRDFVEFPSQLNENWLETPEVLKMLKNAKGEAMPQAMVDKIKKARNFNQGFQVVEYLAAAIVDMKLHQLDRGVDPRAFEKTALNEIGMPKEIALRHRLPQFNHLFSGEGYAAGYYSYLWSAVLDHDAFEAFLEAKGPYDPAVARRLRDTVMAVGNTVDPDEAFKNFRGRGPTIDGYLRAKGFPVEASAVTR